MFHHLPQACIRAHTCTELYLYGVDVRVEEPADDRGLHTALQRRRSERGPLALEPFTSGKGGGVNKQSKRRARVCVWCVEVCVTAFVVVLRVPVFIRVCGCALARVPCRVDVCVRAFVFMCVEICVHVCMSVFVCLHVFV